MIEITFESIGIKQSKVIKLKCLKFNDLPSNYLLNGNRCWLSDNEKSIVIINENNLARRIDLNSYQTIESEKAIKEMMIKCGDNLMECRKYLKSDLSHKKIREFKI